MFLLKIKIIQNCHQKTSNVQTKSHQCYVGSSNTAQIMNAKWWIWKAPHQSDLNESCDWKENLYLVHYCKKKTGSASCRDKAL